jgi:GNAT superfamily N-acetyltransferase
VTPLAVERFGAAHVADAGALLAARHRADRAHEPRLPADGEDPATAAAVVAAIAKSTPGLVALRSGGVVGYLLGSTVLPAPTTRGALYLDPRSALVGYAGHAVDPADDAVAIYRALYAALSPAWVDAGYYVHYVAVAASDRAARDAWFSLGFGHDATLALRDTAAPEAGAPDVDVRRGTAADLADVVEMALGLYRHHASAPIYLPYLAEVEPDERSAQAQALVDPECAHWIARRDGRAIGMHVLQPPPPWLPPLVRPERCTYLLHGYTEAAARGGGVGRALLVRSLAWARKAGHEHCLLHFLAANVSGARFWLAAGFRPIELRLRRAVDRRIAWARPRR